MKLKYDYSLVLCFWYTGHLFYSEKHLNRKFEYTLGTNSKLIPILRYTQKKSADLNNETAGSGCLNERAARCFNAQTGWKRNTRFNQCIHC